MPCAGELSPTVLHFSVDSLILASLHVLISHMLSACCQARGDTPSPLHGPNQWPRQLPEFDAALRKHIRSCLGLGQALMRGAPPPVRWKKWSFWFLGLDALHGELHSKRTCAAECAHGVVAILSASFTKGLDLTLAMLSWLAGESCRQKEDRQRG